jgi:hypothetical protein
MKQPKSNKPRGPVKLAAESGATTTRTANPERRDPNQAQGPRSGNAGNTAKQRAFLADKSDRTSYFQQLADMVSGAFGARGAGMQGHRDRTVEPISDNTRVRRGPTRGNK